MTGRIPLGRSFTPLWAATLAASLGDGIRLAALPLLAASLTADPVLVSGLTAALYLPWLLFGLVAGALADRWDRRTLMWRVDLARVVMLGCFAAGLATGRVTIAVLYALAVLLGLAEALFDNAAQAIVPSLVESGALERANQRIVAAQFVGLRFVGPTVGGVLFALHPATPFLLDVIVFAVATGLILVMRAPARQALARRPLRHEIRLGLGWLCRHRALRAVAVAAALNDLLTMAWFSLLVLYALTELRIPEASYGLLLAAGAAGGLLGAMISPRLARFGAHRVLPVMLGGCAVAQFVLGLTASPVVAAAMLALNSLAFSVWGVIAVSLRQRLVPDELQGRVNSVFRTTNMGAIPLGAGLGGLLADVAGVRGPFLLGAPAQALLGIALALGLYRHRDSLVTAG